jgi:hypothetical protein
MPPRIPMAATPIKKEIVNEHAELNSELELDFRLESGR